jgi:putative ABC transport system permease protein
MRWISQCRDDARFAVRQLAKAPGFAAVAGLTIALGIGATSAIFSVVHAVVLRPLPYAEPDRLMVVGEDFEGRGQPSDVSVGNFTDWRKHAVSFSALGAEQYVSLNLSDNEQPERVVGGRVTHTWFSVFGVPPERGRVFTAEEDVPGRDQVVVLSHRLWTRRYGADPAVVGRVISLNARPFTVVGIMPARFDVTVDAEELWTPAAFTPAQLSMHDEHYLSVIGRLSPGVSQVQAAAELRTIHRQMQTEYPGDSQVNLGILEPLHQQFVGDYRQRLLVLLGAVGLVLLIACGNVANLLLARGGLRAREMALRAAIGASHGRILRQLLTETLVLTTLGSALGILFARLGVPALLASSPEGVPRLEQAHVDGWVLAFASGAALFSAVVTGLVPALRAASTDLRGALNEGGRTATSGRDRVRQCLVAAEVALAIVLLVGAGLLVRSALHLQRTDPGFDPHGVMTARLTLPAARYEEAQRVAQAFEEVVSALADIPSVETAAATTSAPLTPGGNGNGLLPEGQLPEPKNFITTRLAIVTVDFFRALRVPLVRGRFFRSDDRRGGLRVAVVNEATARALFPGVDPIGRRFSCCDGTVENPGWRTIVGVVKDMRSRGPEQEPRPEFFLPIAQAPEAAWTWIQRTMTVVARSRTGDASALTAAARQAVGRVDSTVPVYQVRSMEERLRASVAQARFNTLLMLLLGGSGLLLSAIGVYGVIAYFVTERRQEIAIRMALGARGADVVRMVVRQGMQPVLLGMLLGVAAAYSASRVLAAYVHGVTTSDPLTFAGVVALLAAVALAATALPARQAIRIAPSAALRQ